MVSNGAQLIIDGHRKGKQLAWPCWLCCCTNQWYSPINGHPWIDPSLTERGIEWMKRSPSHAQHDSTPTTIILRKPLKWPLEFCKKWSSPSSNHWRIDRQPVLEYKDPVVQTNRWEWSRTYGPWISTTDTVNGLQLSTEILKHPELKA